MRTPLAAALLLVAAVAAPARATDPSVIRDVIRTLNDHPTVKATEGAASYRVLFDARLDMSPAPYDTGDDFNLETIHPGMPEWSTVAGWAESNGSMVEAIREAAQRTVIGLPYGIEEVPSRYREKGVCIDVGHGDNLHDIRFPYLEHVDLICAFATAESYRLLEANEGQAAYDLYRDLIFVMRMFCDRDFIAEKKHHCALLSAALSNLRDMFFMYMDRPTASAEIFSSIGWSDLPFLRPDRSRLLMPEADRMVAEKLLDSVFDRDTGTAVADRFSESFAGIQSADQPLTRFGAARRWRMIAEVHGSLDASQERLTLVYDDWWRRWRVQEYDAILAIPTEFERTNEVRYAAVVYSLQDIEELFAIRNRLIAEVNGTAMAAGLCAYKKTFDNWPTSSLNVRPQFVRKVSDTDPFDVAFGPFKYRTLARSTAIETPYGRVRIEGCILYSVGENHEDERGEEHAPGRIVGDLVIWPPIKALAREQGKLD